MGTNFIVVFDSDTLTVPYGWDYDCEGAITSHPADAIAEFSSRKAARKAIEISKAFAKLLKLQGKIANDDFLDSLKCIKIVPLRPAKTEVQSGS